MVGPLRRAYEEGRLRLHAVDLLSAASTFLTHGIPADGTNGTNGSNGENGANGANGANGTHEPHGSQKQRAAFDAFGRDLTDYLNSSDYTHEFIRDSLRQGTLFCQEAINSAKGDTFEILRSKQQVLRTSVAIVEEKLAAMERLQNVNWEGVFALARKHHNDRVAQLITARSAQLEKDLGTSLDRWYEGSDSLQDLAQKQWTGLLREAGTTLSDEIAASSRAVLQTPLGGAEPPAAVMLDLSQAGVDLEQVAAAAQPGLSLKSDPAPYGAAIPADAVPVKKSLGDWLLFRSMATVRKRTFGEDMALAIEPEVKAKRLGSESRTVLEELMDKARTDLFPKSPQSYSDRLVSGYTAKYVQEMQSALKERRAELEAERQILLAPFEANVRILEALDKLRDAAADAISGLERLAEEERALGHTVPSLTGAAAAIEPAEMPVAAVMPDPVEVAAG
jgi:hypothetical protein